MKFLNYCVLLTLFCCVLCSNENAEEQYEGGDGREGKQLRKHIEHEGWRVIDSRNWEDSGEWIPRDSSAFKSDEENPAPRRRRIRKRKRRPPQLNPEETDVYPPRRRRIRPQTLEDASDTWSNIEEESLRRPYSRRRTTPVYLPEIQTEDGVELIEPLSAVLHFEENKTERPPEPPRVYEKVRDPFTALEEAEAKARLKKKQQEIELNKEETTTVSNLKALLKQSGSLSLSELLQQKNLSLEDLLNGKEQAISALTEKSESVTEYKKFEEVDFTELPKIVSVSTEKVKSTENPNVLSFNKSTNRNYEAMEDSSEITTPNEELYTQRTRLGLLHHNEGAKLFTSKNYEVVTEPTTERRIFIPSYSKHHSSYNSKTSVTSKIPIKHTTKPFGTTRATPTSSTRKHILGNKYLDYRSKYISLRPKLKTLPMTSAKLNRLVSKHPEVETTTPFMQTTTALPPKAITIDIKDILETPQTTPEQDGPIKMTFDIGKLMEKLEKPLTTVKPQTDLKILENAENEVTPEGDSSTEFNYEKIEPTSARDEIMEILRDQVSRQNLSRILELRNMTIEELVAQRERGSSQLHLADIFHNQTREPEPPNEPYVGHIRSLPHSFFDRKPKTISEIRKDSEGSNYFTSVDIKPLQLNYEEKEKELEDTQNKPSVPVYTVTSFPTYKIEMEKIMKNNQPPPFQISLWKNLYPNLYPEDTGNVNQEDELDVLKPTKVEDIFQNDIRRVEDVENTISEAVNGQLNIELNENNYEDVTDYFPLPRGVKSTIIASAAIIGISVFVFLTVFIIFKWMQKQKKRLCYSSSFSCSRIKSPILETRPRRTIRTIMSETLGRKKKYSNVYPQSMSDYIWESDKKPFQ